MQGKRLHDQGKQSAASHLQGGADAGNGPVQDHDPATVDINGQASETDPKADDPSINTVLTSQMDVDDYAQVENQDKEALQKELADQIVTPEDFDKDKMAEGTVDDRNTSEGQLTGAKPRDPEDIR